MRKSTQGKDVLQQEEQAEGPAVYRGQGDTRGPPPPTNGTQPVHLRNPVHLHEAVGKPGGNGEIARCTKGKGATSSRCPLDRARILMESARRTQICFLKIILMIHVFNYIPVPRGHGGASLNKSNK